LIDEYEDENDIVWLSKHQKLFYKIGERIEDVTFNIPLETVPKPSNKFWLPIDDYIKQLSERRRSPMLRSRDDMKSSVPILSLASVPMFVRMHLGTAFKAISSRDPAERQRRKSDVDTFIDRSGTLTDAISALLDTSQDNWIVPIFDQGLPAREKALRYHFGIAVRRSLLEIAVELKLLEGWAFAALDEVSPALGGRPRVDWKHDFVARLAHTWTLITDRPPSPKPNSLFAEFIHACWLSGGEELEEISFDRTIRAVASNWPDIREGDKTFDTSLWLSSSLDNKGGE
jgi:hypothetical protein